MNYLMRLSRRAVLVEHHFALLSHESPESMLRRVVLLGQLEIVLGALVVQAGGGCEQLGDRVLPIVPETDRSVTGWSLDFSRDGRVGVRENLDQ
jgi:hypothetical protein